MSRDLNIRALSFSVTLILISYFVFIPTIIRPDFIHHPEGPSRSFKSNSVNYEASTTFVHSSHRLSFRLEKDNFCDSRK